MKLALISFAIWGSRSKGIIGCSIPMEDPQCLLASGSSVSVLLPLVSSRMEREAANTVILAD